jgi:drug/metabolite transporter (DMT)-like permease
VWRVTFVQSSLEAGWAGLFGYLLADHRLGAAGWGGCALILAGILLAEPAAAGSLRYLRKAYAA